MPTTVSSQSATTTVPTHRVGKPFDGLGRRFESGALVDTSEWSAVRVRQMTDQRYLIPLTAHEVVALTTPEAPSPSGT